MTPGPVAIIRESRGAAVVELGLFAPILVALFVGLVEVAHAYSERLALEQVAHRVVEKVQRSSFSTSTKAELEAEAEAVAGGGANAKLTWWLECNETKMTSSTAYEAGCTSGQRSARFVQLEIRKVYTPIVPINYLNVGPDGSFQLSAVAGIRIQ